MTNQTAQIIAAEDGPWAQLRTGTITSAGTTSVVVLVGGTQIEAGFQRGATFTAGDLVAVLRQDATWLVLFALAGAGPNQIQNPSFELDGPGLPPSMWFLADITGLSEVVVATGTGLPDGDQYAVVLSDSATSQSYLYSSPIQVTSGDTFNVSVYATGIYDVDAPQTASADLFGLWFATETALYPTTSSADTLIASQANVPSGPPFVQISGTVVAPVTGFMRIGLRSSMSVGQSVGWDLAIARKVG